MTLFFDTDHCKSHAHCKKCRSFSKGRKWREHLVEAYEGLPGPDFTCPEGTSWDRGIQARPVSALPDHISHAGWDDLIELVRSLPAPVKYKGFALIEKERLEISRADCSPCREATALDKVRRWYRHKEVDVAADTGSINE